ncbi:Hypothetical predicted protein [Olea europaea subsp. europaea]|uniref:Glycosyltransferase family 92 protein n=1 Tax=Olea europaea subsp. europaea TaxID=158383 RepID=A0A8S0RTL9_OLEEU|nr:Hypothetical predicted protein [Olea europaea subsp. europaea]
MARKVRNGFLYFIGAVIVCTTFYHLFLYDGATISARSSHVNPSSTIQSNSFSTSAANNAIHENITANTPSHFGPSRSISTTSILLPGWEVLVIVSPEDTSLLESESDEYVCLFDTNEASPAKSAGVLPFPNRATFKCVLPVRIRRRRPFKQPILKKLLENQPETNYPPPLLLRWNFIVYDSLTNENDVILFVKGVNNRQGTNRDPKEFRCVFGDDVINGVKTAVTASMQEVFRCQRPEPTAVSAVDQQVNVSIEIIPENRVVPSVAYYTPPRSLEKGPQKSLLCACTMVYNVAKFLKEWVLYHSKIGVEKFLLYDNGSDDNLAKVVEELVKEGFDVKTYFWFWPKTQEAGFSHSSVYAKNACTWMMFIDVDEFVYSPSWHDSPRPSKSMLQSLISPEKVSTKLKLGQFSINCHEFGPSNQRIHPLMGVTQGYNCRRKYENRHKSVTLLSAIDDSLVNAIHHFGLRPGYKTRKLRTKDMVVNHYKYQAWPEFKTKFRRRVSAYVLDWTKKVNPKSKDRTPGLGFSPTEPNGWPKKFCEVHDDELKELTRKWFGNKSRLGFQMPWQR